MKLKNKPGPRYITAALIMMMLLTLAGCSNSNDSFIEKEVNPNIDVFAVKMLMDEKSVHEAIGAEGEKAMCVYGYEYDYSDKLINIGFNSDAKLVRRVSSKNPETSIYGIKPGMELTKAYKIITSNGFKKDSKYKFSKDNVILSITSMKGTNADGIAIEIDPDQE